MADGAQRIDKWLFFARVVKSRSLAQKLVSTGAVRINRDKTDNPARNVRPGDVLTISLRGAVRVLKVVDPGTRRGPASEAAGLFEDLSPPREPTLVDDAAEDGDDDEAEKPRVPPVPAASPGRVPTRIERRALQRLKRGDEE